MNPGIWPKLAGRILSGTIGVFRRILPAPFKNELKKTGAARGVQRWLNKCTPYELDMCSAIQRLVQPGWACADVGAHVGVITELFAKLVGSAGLVVAFEAHPENVQLLRENIRANGCGNQVRVEHFAVSDGSRDRVWLFPGRQHSSHEWNIVGHDVEGIRTDPELEVPAISLDDYFPSGSRLHLVKIDVEGAEAQVLAGMRRLLREARPVAIIEFHDEVGWAGRQELLAAAYDLYDMSGRRLDPSQDVQRIYHCLAVPRDVA